MSDIYREAGVEVLRAQIDRMILDNDKIIGRSAWYHHTIWYPVLLASALIFGTMVTVLSLVKFFGPQQLHSCETAVEPPYNAIGAIQRSERVARL